MAFVGRAADVCLLKRLEGVFLYVSGLDSV